MADKKKSTKKPPWKAVGFGKWPADALQIGVSYKPSRGDATPVEYVGGVVTFTLPEGEQFEIEAWIRPGYSTGLYVRALDGLIDIEADAANTVRIKPRAR